MRQNFPTTHLHFVHFSRFGLRQLFFFLNFATDIWLRKGNTKRNLPAKLPLPPHTPHNRTTIYIKVVGESNCSICARLVSFDDGNGRVAGRFPKNAQRNNLNQTIMKGIGGSKAKLKKLPIRQFSVKREKMFAFEGEREKLFPFWLMGSDFFH